MNELALFAGAGGGILGGHLLGWKTVCAVEINDYARRVLMARQDDGCLEPFPIWDDVATFDGRPWRGIIDVVSGGFPCQDISSSGSGVGIGGQKSGLWTEMFRVVCEVRPRFVFVENSSELTHRGLGRVLGDLASGGYDARWLCFSAAYAGSPQGRDRIWIVAHACGRRQQAVFKRNLAQSENMRWAHFDGLATAQHRASEAKAEFYRMDDAVAYRLDRLRATGNGQVSTVVRLAWETLTNDRR